MNVADISGVPDGVAEFLGERGIEELYPPQAEAVESGLTRGESVVASVPTASGKTLIAELAMLGAVKRGGKALYIVPLRALASEKAAEFEALERFGLRVGITTGNYEADGDWLAERDIVVATSEKVDSLVRNRAQWLEEIDCVVADEVHLVDDSSRGPTLEVTLAKLRSLCTELQVVALSATIGNPEAIAAWLDAELVDSTWRPIELRTGVQLDGSLEFDDGSSKALESSANTRATGAVVEDTLEDGGSTLVFVNSRNNAEAAARRLADVVKPTLDDEQQEELGAIAEAIRDVSDTETSRDLAEAVELGGAFHHAGLAREHRTLIEDAFRDRHVKVVAATPTLAAGVNTPSRRVVVRDWRRYDGSVGGMKPLDALEVHQMFGRAGRPGLDPFGEAVLIASSREESEELFERYVYADPEPVRSKLAAEPALRTHVLATVATGFARTRSDLLRFLDDTLYASQTAESERLASVTDTVLEYLEANAFLERSEDGGVSATRIGRLVSRLYLDPMSAAEIVDGLRAIEDSDQELTALGCYHLVSRTPDMYELYLRSGDKERYTEIAYDCEEELPGPAPSEFETERYEDWLSALKTGKLLEDWASEVDEERITERYGVGPGDIRGKVEIADWLLGAAEQLAGQLDFECAMAVQRARRRVADGVKAELLELSSVRNVGRKRARRLYDRGIERRSDLRDAQKSVVLAALRGRRATAETILENAGHQNPSMDGVSADGSTAGSHGDGGTTDSASSERTESEDQANLGDF